MKSVTKNENGDSVQTTKHNIVFPDQEWAEFTAFVDALTVGRGRAHPVTYTYSETVVAAIRLLRMVGVEAARETIEAYARRDDRYFADIADAVRRGLRPAQ